MRSGVSLLLSASKQATSHDAVTDIDPHDLDFVVAAVADDP